MSNPSPNQKRNLKPTVSAGAYSASPSQLTLSTDQITSSALGQHPYQQQNYTYSHDPSAAFAFPPHPQYRTHQQPQSLKQDHYAQHLQQQNQQQHHNLASPTHSRKRRVSELGDPSLPSASSSNNSAFANAPGPFSSNSADVDLGLGPPAALPSPAPKKGRTNTPWTPAEEQRLKTLRDAGSSWSEIAKTFPTRTEGSVKKHWYKDMHYAEFAEDEVSTFSAALLQAIKDYENNKWKVIGQKVGKPAKACEQFAKEQGWKV